MDQLDQSYRHRILFPTNLKIDTWLKAVILLLSIDVLICFKIVIIHTKSYIYKFKVRDHNRLR